MPAVPPSKSGDWISHPPQSILCQTWDTSSLHSAPSFIGFTAAPKALIHRRRRVEPQYIFRLEHPLSSPRDVAMPSACLVSHRWKEGLASTAKSDYAACPSLTSMLSTAGQRRTAHRNASPRCGWARTRTRSSFLSSDTIRRSRATDPTPPPPLLPLTPLNPPTSNTPSTIPSTVHWAILPSSRSASTSP